MLIDKYNKGFDIIAMTDHDVLTDDWTAEPDPNTGLVNSDGTPSTSAYRVMLDEAKASGTPINLTGYEMAAIRSGVYGRTKTNGMIGMGMSNEWSAFDEPNVTLATPVNLKTPAGVDTTITNTSRFPGHHINTFFANLPLSAIPTGERTLAKIAEEAGKLGGISHINHPGRYTGAYRLSDGASFPDFSNDANIIETYVTLFMDEPTLVGKEIINKWDGESVNDRILWDNILKETMAKNPQRPVWGFSNDDSHSLSGNGHAWNVMLMPTANFNPEGVKKSMIDGAFYAVTRVDRQYSVNGEIEQVSATNPAHTPELPVQTQTTADQYTGGPRNAMALTFLAQTTPSISNITVTGNTTIAITGANFDRIDWVADGKIIATGTSLNITSHQAAIGRYVRAVLYSPTGVAYTQPFGVNAAVTEITLNPYSNVNWTTTGQYKAAHHTHSLWSDGSNRRRDMLIDKYNKDFDIVAMTDHDVLTADWTAEPNPSTGLVNTDGTPSTSPYRVMLDEAKESGTPINLTADELTAINNGTYGVFPGTFTGRRQQKNGMITMGMSNEWSAFNEPNVTLSKEYTIRGVVTSADPTPADITVTATSRFPGHHINTFFANLPLSAIPDGQRTLANIAKKNAELGGISHINHPGRYTGAYRLSDGASFPEFSMDENIVKTYVDLFMNEPTIVGKEIINKWDGESVNDRLLWDNILMQTIPQGRRVWGFSNDDSHSLSGNGHAWNVMLMPTANFNEAGVRTSMETGAFYAVTRVDRQYSVNGEIEEVSATNPAHTPELPVQTTTTEDQYTGGPRNEMALRFLSQTTPSISNIAVNQENLTITISGANFDRIEWIADGKLIHTGTAININEHLGNGNINSYVRAVLVSATGIAYTQPFPVGTGAIVSVLAQENVIPENINNDIALVTPATPAAAIFTAGPNPVSKSAGAVNFYYQGKRVESGTLTIYNAAGNVINKIRLSDNAAPGKSAKRMVSSWNLTDSKGRQIADGTYLVRGTVIVEGKRQKVSLLVGVK